MVKLGLIAFANDGGIGAQTRRLAYMLKPDRIMVVNSSGFSQNKAQHFEWYKGFNFFVVGSFPTNEEVRRFLPGLTHVLCVENPYNFGLVHWGQEQGTKILVQSNYEFCQNIAEPWLPVPDKFIMPSFWKLDEMKKRFGENKVTYLPPPIDPDEFKKTREKNLSREGKIKFLHVIGTPAAQDRNGTFDVLEAVRRSKGDFELTVRSQHPLSMDVFLDDPRIVYEVENIKENASIFDDFDALLLPRRWGGLSLTLNESMMAGMVPLVTDISPQDMWIPQEWRVKSIHKGAFPSKVGLIDFYSVDHQVYANKIDEFAAMGRGKLEAEKEISFRIASSAFSQETLLDQYLYLFNDWKS